MDRSRLKYVPFYNELKYEIKQASRLIKYSGPLLIIRLSIGKLDCRVEYKVEIDH